MVVLEEGSMLTTGHNQYLPPDYFPPHSTTLDAKKSPLAMLAQTCSQIGADSPTKPLLPSLDKSSKNSAANARSPPAAKLERTRSSPADGKPSSGASNLAFKPYETNVVSTKRNSSSSDDNVSSRPGSKASSVHSASGADSANNSASDMIETNNNNTSGSSQKKSANRSTPQSRKSASPAQQQLSSSPSNTERKTPAAAGERDKSSASPRNNSGNSPIIRSGMEILSGHSNPKDASSLQSMYKSGSLGAFGASALCCPPGLENPAFRPTYPGASAFSHHHAAATAALLGYPSATAASSSPSSPYLSYTRVKTPSGGETLVPVCKDPFCTGCQYSMHNAQMMMAAAAAASGCPSGCTQCDHQKYGLMALSSLGHMGPPPSLVGYSSHLAAVAAAAASGGKMHVCSWMVGDSFCGKRFGSPDELLQHLRSHTSPGSGPEAASLLAAGQHSHPLLSSTAALHRAAAAAAAGSSGSSSAGSYPAPSLSPLSARFHPYGKPPTGPPLPASLAASPYSAFNPLGPYAYSPYAIYGQRIGAAVHP